MISFAEFLAKWINPAGQRIDTDGVPAGAPYQCVDLPKQYCREVYGMTPGAWGNAINYWTTTAPALLTKFVKVDTQEPQAGDITVLTSPITSLGHIGIATGVISGTQFQMMEQNGSTGDGSGTGNDAIRTRFVTKSRIVGVLRPITVAAPAPATPMIGVDQLTQLYQTILRRAPDVGAIQHYVGHYTYDFVQSDLLNSSEYKQLLANDAAASAAAAQAAADAAKAAEQPIPPTPAPPTAPLPVPTSSVKYPIVTTVPTYSGLTNAINKSGATGEILAGASWYIFCEKSGMYNLTRTPGSSQGLWINPSENVVPLPPAPEPEPAPKPAPRVETAASIRGSFLAIMPDGSPIDCLALTNCLAVDVLGHGNAITITKGQDLKIYGTFMAANHFYALVKIKDKATQDNYMYGVVITSRDNFEPFLDDIYKLSDHIQRGWELVIDKSAKTIEGICRAVVSKINKNKG